MMKCYLLFLTLFITKLPGFSQINQQGSANKPVTGNIYAVVIGIANYENQDLNLNYSNRDARIFAEYLQSNTGGDVPSQNIKLLIDTSATTAAIYGAMTWLEERCKIDKEEDSTKTDLVYFYFSGHGDVETDTRANLGFLLSYNTPPYAYLGNAVRLEDLNLYAHSLSIDLKANVIIITDACHSGKLAGSNKGSFLVGKELSAAKEKEIRIASCKPDEKSSEDERWGGGRGVFSYYLINGLKGLADKDHDNIVTLSEIKSFVDSSIAQDPVIIQNKLPQTSVAEGNQEYKLASVNAKDLLVLKSSLVVVPPEQSDQDYFFTLLRRRNILESMDYKKLDPLSKEEIPFAFIRFATGAMDKDDGLDKIGSLERSLKDNKEALKEFNEQLVEALHSTGQKMINLYLDGDAAELERRRYYNSDSNGYEVYPAMYAIALKLIEPGNALEHILKVNQYYFTGIVARLKIPLVEEAKQKLFIEEGIAAQKKALALEENAAYIQNELGILYQTKKEYAAAEKYFINATRLAPSWAIPQGNLCGLYAIEKNFAKANEAGQAAEVLQPNLQLTVVNLGATNELSGNLLLAEEYYRNAIDINSRHYLPFERLGFVYMNTTQYAQADSFFHEADLRKKGYHFQKTDVFAEPFVLDYSPVLPMHCEIDTLALQRDDIMAFFTWGVQAYQERDYPQAVRAFKKIIALDKTNPLVFHYIGKIFYDENKWEDAEIMFKFAADYWLDDDHFNKYCDSVISSKKYPYAHDCFEQAFRFYQYKKIEDYWFLAILYESWSHYAEAELTYRQIISFEPAGLGGYVKLWRILEKLGRYTEAENTIKGYAQYDKERSDRELNGFYKRTINLFPESSDWYYRLGLLLYDRAALQSRALYLDTIIWFPKINKEIFIDSSNYSRLGSDPLTWDKTIPGSPQIINAKYIGEQEATIVVPGPNELITLARPIYTPRKDAITYLSKAAELSAETDAQADINFKIGNVFIRAGSKKQAYPYYERSILLAPDNANARLNFIDVCKSLYKNRAGLEQLNYLYEHNQINFEKRLLLAEFDIHAGQFDTAKKIIGEAQNIYPYTVPATFDLLGRLNLLSNRPALAIPFYKNYLAVHADNGTLYTLARAYAQTKNSTEAWKWLEAAMKNGFNYSYILNYDPSWNDFRNSPKWNELMKKYAMKKYAEPLHS